jgi:hypothetical protein
MHYMDINDLIHMDCPKLQQQTAVSDKLANLQRLYDIAYPYSDQHRGHSSPA